MIEFNLKGWTVSTEAADAIEVDWTPGPTADVKAVLSA